MAGGRAGRAREQGPPGPATHPTVIEADRDLFVVVPAQVGHDLFCKGDLIPAQYDGLATVPAVWQDEVLVPGEE